MPIPNRRRAGWGLLATVASLLIAGWTFAGRGGGLSGEYREVSGLGALEFKGRRVYVTTVVGTVFAAEYEVDGKRVILKGPGGSQVLTREGDAIQGGLNMKYVRVDRD
ncbi:MAG: hypothetical protein KF684_07620 [Phycisphaeraceae bacterium]|nr:hypothetical protein [Phycisphaeraceae bacterium]